MASMSPVNPSKWRFTWEAQSHSPTLRLLLFDSCTNPVIHCKNLEVHLNLQKFHLLVKWFGNEDSNKQVSLKVPIPKVLIDPESSPSFKCLNDHIDVKLVLLLPVDHPIIARFDSVLNLSDIVHNIEGDEFKPLAMDSDIKRLSSENEVHFYCKSCLAKLTSSPIRQFVEMPSIDWNEVADNWFGGCCCSFGGISEKLVTRYVNLYKCAAGVCLLHSATIMLHKDDLLEFKFPSSDGSQKSELGSYILEFKKLSMNSNGLEQESNHNSSKLGFMGHFDGKFTGTSESETNEEESTCCSDTTTYKHNHNDAEETSVLNQNFLNSTDLTACQKSFLNGFLGNIFMARSSNLSTDIKWMELRCPGCSSLIGAYPQGNGETPMGGGVQLFKCYISTSLVAGGSSDIFREYSLEKMFTYKLLETAKDELSFKTVLKDLTTKSPVVQIVLLNPNSWCATGDCLDIESTESIFNIGIYPVIKVLFSDCSDDAESQSRKLGAKVSNEVSDEAFMLRHQIEALIECLESAKGVLPPSYTTIQGFQISSLRR